MGEAASRVSAEFRGAHPQVDWDFLIRIRNFHFHVYDAVNYGKVWSTVTRMVRRVEAAVLALLPTAEDGEPVCANRTAPETARSTQYSPLPRPSAPPEAVYFIEQRSIQPHSWACEKRPWESHINHPKARRSQRQ